MFGICTNHFLHTLRPLLYRLVVCSCIATDVDFTVFTQSFVQWFHCHCKDTKWVRLEMTCIKKQNCGNKMESICGLAMKIWWKEMSNVKFCNLLGKVFTPNSLLEVCPPPSRAFSVGEGWWRNNLRRDTSWVSKRKDEKLRTVPQNIRYQSSRYPI